MKKLLIFTLLLSLTWLQADAQLTNGYFTSSSCSNTTNAFNAGCVPGWSNSHGTPSIVHDNGNRAAFMYSYGGQSEGILANYDFNAGCGYTISYRVKTGDKGTNDPNVANARFYIVAANNVPSSTSSNVPSVSSRQTVGSRRVGDHLNQWNSVSHYFVPSTNYSQVWIYPYMQQGSNSQGSQTELRIDNIVVTPNSPYYDPDFYMTATGNTSGYVSVSCTANTQSGPNHLWDVYYDSSNQGWATGNTQVPGIPSQNGTTANFGSNLSTNTWYYVKHGVYDDCSDWNERRRAFRVGLTKGSKNGKPAYKVEVRDPQAILTPEEIKALEADISSSSSKKIGLAPQSITLYPNPTQVGGNIQLEASQAVKQVELFDTTGRKIEVNVAGINQKDLQFSLNDNISPGLYMLRIIHEDDSTQMKKLVVR